MTHIPHEEKHHLGEHTYVRWDNATQTLCLTAKSDFWTTDQVLMSTEVVSALITYLKAQLPDATFWGEP